MITSVKYMFCLIVIVGILGGTVIFGLKETVQVKSASQEVEAVVYPLKLVLSLNKTEYTLGESVTIDLQLTNISNSTVTLWFRNRSPLRWLGFKVYDASNDLVLKSESLGFLVPEAATEVSLYPDSFIGQTHEWDQKAGEQWYDLHQLEVGTYKIIGFLDDLYGLNGIINYETPPIQIETPPIQIYIG